MQIIISDEIQKICPSLTLGIVQAKVTNSPTPQFLSEEMTALETEFRQQYTLEELNKRPAILATRLAYKALGKEPGRYRPSAEALCRRILREIPLADCGWRPLRSTQCHGTFSKALGYRGNVATYRKLGY